MQGPPKGGRYPNLLYILNQGLVSRGCDINIASKLSTHMSSCPLLTDVQEVTRALKTTPDPSDAEAVRVAKLFGGDMTYLLMGIKAALVAKGVCREEEYEDLVRGHIREVLEGDHTVYWTRCFARRREVGVKEG
ncbi:hypothetical protein HDV00_011870 [Rhizophlyctis rosea]|nr:hypothetical protein HDV00_011870 [Rhizophlyctis rosea]